MVRQREAADAAAARLPKANLLARRSRGTPRRDRQARGAPGADPPADQGARGRTAEPRPADRALSRPASLTILTAFGFPKLNDPEPPYIDGNFVPHVRGNPYRDIGSTGALTLISLAWILAIFEQALEGGYPHPGFLLIDSPQKNLTPAETPGVADEFRDPAIVQRVWEHIMKWSNEVAGPRTTHRRRQQAAGARSRGDRPRVQRSTRSAALRPHRG